ncbi:helicase subunit [Proboscivirus elephantidbeta4]|uniref:Helicase subunit n=6 Tax=Elephant endotheliotropic herpesvirus 4 TaxID=548914 RepID=A0A0S1TPJ9_9BETA|nr:helicase subunit [Elephant endotheliotropic herpesvirus 4]ALM26025.1 helicase subunit [Elephant endotheliotropic herpesvirus 4]
MTDASGGMFDTGFFLNMCSASKVERIVDKVRALAARRLDAPLPYNWFGVMGDPERDPYDLPFFPFTAVAVTGTAGAGKTVSVQVLAANLRCLCTGATVIAAQNLSSVLNRSKAAQVRTIHKEFGFNSRHVSMLLRDSNVNITDVASKQRHELSRYWAVLSDIADSALEAGAAKARAMPICRHNIIVIDEAGVILEHMLHAVVFMYWFYNALGDTPQYRRRLVPCLVCIGSPTQSEAITTTFDHSRQNSIVRRGRDILSSLICDPHMMRYCDTERNWVLFINNKRCTDVDFGSLLKHIEFGLPLTPEHLAYVDRFVRPGSFIKDPRNVPDMTRLFISHSEVQEYYRTLHAQLQTSGDEKRNLFVVPIYCILNVREFEDYVETIGNPHLKKEAWFEMNKPRIWNYSQFADQDLSNTTVVAAAASSSSSSAPSSSLSSLWATGGYGGSILGGEEDGGGDDDGHRAAVGGGGAVAGEEDEAHQLFKCEFTYIRSSAVSVSSKLKCCVIGYEGTYDEFVEILQKDLFLEAVPYEQINYAYSFLIGLLYSGMFTFYTHDRLSHDLLLEMRNIPLPHIEGISRNNHGDLCGSEYQWDAGRSHGANNEGSGAAVAGAVAADVDARNVNMENYGAFRTTSGGRASGNDNVGEGEERSRDDDDEVRASGDATATGAAAGRGEGQGKVETERGGGGVGEEEEGKDGGGNYYDAELDRMMCDATGLYNDAFYDRYENPPVSCSTFEETIYMYTVFKDIFLKRYYASQKHTGNEFGGKTFVTYNRRNVSVRNNRCEIVSHSKSFIGLLSYTSPAKVYTLQGYTHDMIMAFARSRHTKATQVAHERRVPRLILKDALGFMQVIEHNVSHFSDTANGRTFAMCTAIDYGISPKIAMTITKSQGLSLDKVAVHFGDGTKPLKLNQIYVAISRVTNPQHLIINVNPLRGEYINNNHITRYIAMGLKNPHTHIIY